MTALSETARAVPAPQRPGQGDPQLVLQRCRGLVQPALAVAVQRLPDWLGEMAAYSFGWCEVGGTVDPDRTSAGKGVRQALAVLGAEAAGAPGETAISGAVAVELVHTFSLLHDDIMDGDELRRQRPTVWKAYGTGPAVLSGDALFALAMELLAETPNAHGGHAVRQLAAALGELIRGQADDLQFESRPWAGPDAVQPGEYRSMAEAKTGALLGCSLALGAALAGAPGAVVDGLDRAGRHLGVAFQIVDDLLGIWGDPAATGKPVHNDLRQGKKTHPVLTAVAAEGPAAQRLGALLSVDRPLDAPTARTAAALVEEAGGRAVALREARNQLEGARAALHDLPLAPAAVTDILALLPYLIDRTG